MADILLFHHNLQKKRKEVSKYFEIVIERGTMTLNSRISQNLNL